MKKLLAILLALIMVLTMAACSSETDDKKDNDDVKITTTAKEKDDKKDPDKTEAPTTTTTESVKVDEGLLTVDITLAASFFEGDSEEDIKAAAEDSGFTACRINDDGSVTYTMTKAKHKEMLEELRESFDEAIESLLEGEDAVESFEAINCSEDYSTVDIIVDKEKFTSWDKLYAMTFYITGAYYQAFAGVADEDIDVIVNFVDSKTEEVLETASYKEFISSAEPEGGDDEEEEPTAFDAPVLAEKETVTVADKCEFFVDYTDMTDDVMPLQPGSWYTHYEAENGKMYIDVCVGFKNLSSKDKMADEVMNATLVYGGKYQYSGFSMIEEENRSDFTYSNITAIAPLATEYLHYLFEVPSELESGEGSLFVMLTVEGSTHKVILREGTEGEVASANENAVLRADGMLKAGEVIAIPKACEFFVDYTNITDDVMPPQPADWYTHYEAEAGKLYIDLCVGYRSLTAKERMADELLNAVLIFAGKYEYTGFTMIEESSRGDFTYSNITSVAPLANEYIHYLFEVPEEVGLSDGSLEIRLTVDGNTYDITVREGSEGEVIKVNENAVLKTSGEVKLGEIVAVAGTCEFFVDYSDITDDVMPLYPGDWYSHYEADEGKVYVDFCVGYRNWKNKNVTADDVMAAKLIYDGKYEYTGFSMIEDEGRSDFTYSNITSIIPLSTEYLHFLFEIPAELENETAGIVINFSVGGNVYSYTVR